MVNHLTKIGRVSLAIGIALFINTYGWAENISFGISQQIAHCQTSLQKYCKQLAERSKIRTNQVYYESLYQQTQNFLKSFNYAPLTAHHLDQCHRFRKAIEGIIGNHGSELSPMPAYTKFPSNGQLSNPILEPNVSRTAMRKSIRYVYEEEAQKDMPDGKEEKDELEIIRPSASSFKPHQLKEKELE